MPLHSALTGSDLHESKGVASAPSNRVYITDGAGSGSFSRVGADAMSTTGIGYPTGATAGSTVTQATSKSTTVSLNKACGQITTNSAALAAGANVDFQVTNSLVVATDVIVANVQSAATANAHTVSVVAVNAGSFNLKLTNTSAGSLSQAVVINFAIIKASIT